MKQYDFLTIFPEVILPYFERSIMKRASDAGVAGFNMWDVRRYAKDKHKRVDDVPYGGGAGMIMQVPPIYDAVTDITQKHPHENRRIILLSAKGKRFTQRDAERYTRYDHMIMICGRYEGVDERVAMHITDEEISIGDFVLTGGELGAMVVVDSVVRLLPDVLGNEASAVHESHNADGYTEHPHYTRPEDFNSWRVPEVLLSGDHERIAQWRKNNSNLSSHDT
jgi:tRNA (guanine37-N1)-methyltransferase